MSGPGPGPGPGSGPGSSPGSALSRVSSLKILSIGFCAQELWRYDKPSRTWTSEGEIGGQGGIASLDASGVDDEDSDEFWVT